MVTAIGALVASAVLAWPAKARPPLEITYVANAGFLIECDTTKILIDALFGGWESNWYQVPSDSLISLMKSAQPPFDNVDLVLVTHNHVDHFDPGITADHLANSGGATLVCTEQTEELLAVSCEYSAIEGRIMAVSALPDSAVILRMQGVELRVLSTHHTPSIERDTLTGETVDRNRGLQHLEFVIGMNGYRLFHCGDGDLSKEAKYVAFGFGKDSVDVAFLQAWNAGEQLSYRQLLVRDVIKPVQIILMHRHPDRPLRGDPEKQRGIAREITVPRRSMEAWIVN